MPRFISPQDLSRITFQRFLDFLTYYLRDGMSVLEVGAGDGVLAKRLNDVLKLDYRIFDLADDRVQSTDLPFQIVDVAHQAFPLADNSQDVILGAQVLEHLENMAHFFRECHRVLKPGGRVMIKSPNFSSIFQRLIYLKNGMPIRLGGKISDGGHINFFTHNQLKHFTIKHFTMERVEGDALVEPLVSAKIALWFNKQVSFLSCPKIKRPFFSYNILLDFKKI